VLFDSRQVVTNVARAIVAITSGSTTVREYSKNSNSTALQPPSPSLSRNNILSMFSCSASRRSRVDRIIFSRRCRVRASVYSPKYTLCTPAICLSTHKHFGAAKEGGVSREGRTTQSRYASCLRFPRKASCNTTLAKQHHVYKSRFMTESRGSKSMRCHKNALIFFFTTETPNE